MPEYQVTVTFAVEEPVADEVVDRLMDLLGPDAALAVGGGQFSVTDTAAAEVPGSAISVAEPLVRMVAEQCGLRLGRLVEGHALEWELVD